MLCSDLRSDQRKSEALTPQPDRILQGADLCSTMADACCLLSSGVKPALLINDAWGSRAVVPGSGGGVMGGGVSVGVRVRRALWSSPRVREAASLTAEILSCGLSSHELALINQSMQGLKGSLLKRKERLSWNDFRLYLEWGVDEASSGEGCFHHQLCIAVGRSDWSSLYVALCASSRFSSQCVSTDYLISWRSRVWLQISYLLMASVAEEELNPERRQRFLWLHKLVCTEVERNDRVITVRVDSHPLSSVAAAECTLFLSEVYLFLLSVSEGDGARGCVCAWGYCVHLGASTAVLFNLLTPQWGRCGQVDASRAEQREKVTCSTCKTENWAQCDLYLQFHLSKGRIIYQSRIFNTTQLISMKTLIKEY